MNQNDVVWTLISILQLCVIGFVSHWSRRVQRLEETLATSLEMRTKLLIEFQGRVSVLEAQYGQIMSAIASEAMHTRESLARIEHRMDRTEEE